MSPSPIRFLRVPGFRGRSPLVFRLVAVLAMAALSLSSAVTVFAATPTLTTPAIAEPDSTIAVAGSGFAAGQSGVLTYNGGVVEDFSASSAGAFNVALTVPDWAPLNHTARISAKTNSGALVATTTLYLDPTVSAPTLYVPAQAAPGTQITVDGAGFAAGQTGNLTFNGMVITTFTAVSDGTFGVPFAIPANATIGTDRISAKTSSGTLIATITLAIGNNATGPTVVAPAQAVPGATVTVNGAGFATNQTGVVTYNGVQEATFAADSSCDFAVAIVIPSNATVGSTARISAKTSSGTLIATTTLTIVSGIGPAPTAPPTATPLPTVNPTPTPLPTVNPTPTPLPSVTPTTAPTATPTIAPTPSPTSPPSTTLPNFSHVYVIIFENKEYSQIIGSSSAPYINSLANQYGLSTNFYAERHPSEPNYIALTSGGTQGITDDGTYNLGVNNLFSQVTASGRTWKSWQQGYPGNCFTGSSSSAVVDGVGKSGAYVRKHDPAISYTSISGNSSTCANITNLASFDPAAASFNFITPNMINDMHDGTVADGDNFLKAFLPKIMSSPAFSNSVVFVTFDEGTTNVNGGGHIVTIAITPGMTAGAKASATYTHYSMLRTIEDAWNLPRLGNAGSASDMTFPW